MISNSPIVYVVQDPDGKEITLAKPFGKFYVILTGKETVQQAVYKLHKALVDFTDKDYLLPIGKSVNMGIAIHFAWEALKQKDKQEPFVILPTLKLLIWQREQYAYIVEEINAE